MNELCDELVSECVRGPYPVTSLPVTARSEFWCTSLSLVMWAISLTQQNAICINTEPIDIFNSYNTLSVFLPPPPILCNMY